MRTFFIIYLIFFSLGNLFSQEEKDTLSFNPQFKYGQKYTLKTKSGQSYTGFVVNETKETVTLEDRKNYTRTEIKKNELRVATKFNERKKPKDEEFGENHHASSYILSNSTFLFEDDAATSNSHWFLLESLDYSITENFAVTANCFVFYPISLGIKAAFEISENNYLGGSVFGAGNIFSGSGSAGGPLLWGYGAIAKYTNGTSNNNFSVSGGLLGLRSDIFLGKSSISFVNLGFVNGAYCNRLGEKVALNLEGWYFPLAQTGLAGIAVKFIGNERNCWTLGCFSFLNNLNNNLTLNFRALPIPYFGVSRKF